MKLELYAALLTILPTLLHSQVLRGDEQFPLLNQVRWDMSREKVLDVCAANNVSTGGSDTTVTFDARCFGVEAKTIVRFKNKAGGPRLIEVKFKELTDKFLEALISHFTRTTGEAPVRASKEKSVLLFTMRMEIAMWKTKTENIRLIAGRQNKSIFDINLSIDPTTR